MMVNIFEVLVIPSLSCLMPARIPGYSFTNFKAFLCYGIYN